jgi:hypothetical protein
MRGHGRRATKATDARVARALPPSLATRAASQPPGRPPLHRPLNKHDRARLNLLARIDPVFLGPLDLLAPEPPSTWNGPHVGLRLTEAFVTLRSLPVHGAPRGIQSFWPQHMVEFEDLLAQAETSELERTMCDANRVRVLPSARAVTAAETAIYWPMKYLAGLPELATAVNCVSLAYALERDAGWVVRKRGGSADTWRARRDQGCAIIAGGLVRERAPVF